jgi:hypothetical protein
MEKYHTEYYLKLETGRFTPKRYSNIFKLDSHLKLIMSNYGGNGDILQVKDGYVYIPDAINHIGIR